MSQGVRTPQTWSPKMAQLTSKRRAFKSLVLGMISAGCLALAAPAQADPVTFLPAGADVQFKYNNLETIVSNVGDVLTGIFSISSIGNTSGSLLYWGCLLYTSPSP